MSEQHYVYIDTPELKAKHKPKIKGDEYWYHVEGRWKEVTGLFQLDFESYNIYRRPVTAPEQASPWVDINDRHPSKEDGDKDGRVLIAREGVGNDTYDFQRLPTNFKYWMPIPPLPAPKELSQSEKDEAAFQEWYKSQERGDFLKDAYLAGRRDARKGK